MDSEPPQGDDLRRLLVTMKQDVLARATPRRGPRRRRSGIAIGVVTALLLGAAGGSVALGLIPGQEDRASAPAATATTEPMPTRSPDGAPVVDSPSPTPTPTPTPTATRPPYASDDPRTWTISGTEVGPVALGGAVTEETDDLTAAFADDSNCPNPNVSWWTADGRTPIIVLGQNGVVTGIAVGDFSADQPGPTTAEGLGVGSTLAELRAAYPDLTPVTGADGQVASGTPAWTIVRQGHHITFSMRPDTTVTGSVWVSDEAQEPYEFCG